MCKGAIFLFHYLISQTIGPCDICLVLRDSAILGSEGKKQNKTTFCGGKISALVSAIDLPCCRNRCQRDA